MKIEIEWFDASINIPPEGKSVLVARTDGSVDIRCYVPEEKGYCWGWYPGGSHIKGTFWAYLPANPNSTKSK